MITVFWDMITCMIYCVRLGVNEIFSVLASDAVSLVVTDVSYRLSRNVGN